MVKRVGRAVHGPAGAPRDHAPPTRTEHSMTHAKHDAPTATSGTTRPRRRTRGGQGGAEPGLRIQRREREVLELTTTGLDQYAVAHRLGITQSAVSQILTRVDQRWATENLAYVHRQKAAAARKLDRLYREAMHAWEASKSNKTRRRQRKTDGRDPGQGTTIAEVVVEDSHGDPRYLETARRVLADRDRLWGSRSPAPTDVSAPEIPAVFTMKIGDADTIRRRAAKYQADHTA